MGTSLPLGWSSEEVSKSNGTIDVCLITHNSEKFLDAVLSNIKGVIPYRRIVLVDGESKDSTLEIARHHECEILQTIANAGHQRTLAYKSMETEWFYSSDDDLVLPNNYWGLVYPYTKWENVGLIDCYLRNVYLTDFALTREALFKFRGKRVYARFRNYSFGGCALIRREATKGYDWHYPRRDGRETSQLIRSRGYKLLQLPFFATHYDDKTWEDVLEVHAYSRCHISHLLKLRRVVGVLVHGLRCPWLYHHCVKLAYVMLRDHLSASKYMKNVRSLKEET